MESVPEPHNAPMAGAPEPHRPPMAGAPGQDQRWQRMSEEATCPICLGYFAEPVSVQCGHIFCTPCITRYWEGERGRYICPQCQITAPTNTLRPNWHLANMVQILAQGPPVVPPREEPHMCTQHDEKLKLFCVDDQTPICLICRESRGHRAHTVRPVREAAQEYQDKFQSHLDHMKMNLETILSLQLGEETKVANLEESFKSQRERITTVFNKVQQFLEKEKCRHLSNLEEKEKTALQEIGEKVTKFREQQQSVKSLIEEMESKCQQADVELLKDAKSMLRRYETLKDPPLHLDPFNEQEKLTEKECDVEEKKEDLERKIIESLEWRWTRNFAGEVTLDPDTAHCDLILSEDSRSASLGDGAQDLPDMPERFDTAPIVLGRERLRTGRHYWEVEVGDAEWDLGVCDESVSRKGAIIISPEDGYWIVWLRGGEYEAITDPSIPLTPRTNPRIIGLFLDYEGDRLSVYNVTDRSLLFTFDGVFFPRTLRPYFSPGVTDGGKNGGALRLLPVTGEE